jgi:hypothetical protein
MTRATPSKTAGRRVLSFGLLLLTCTLFGACNLKSDATLMRGFETHSKGFEQLVGMSKSDIGVTRIQKNSVAPSNWPLSVERWGVYQSLFRDLGLKGGMERREDFPSGIFLIEQCSGTAITHDCKGYVYSEESLSPIQEDLDEPPAKIAFKRLANNWYLFRDDG